MRLADLVALSASVAEASSRLTKVGHIADVLRALGPDDVAMAIPFLAGSLRQGKIGAGVSAILAAADRGPSGAPSPSPADVGTVVAG